MKGGRCTWWLLSIEDSEAVDAASASGVFRDLKKRFPDRRVALVHGGMKQQEKDAVMQAFAAGETDILAATVVIEVGINVPNATTMIIENAERFGLAQLHQLRGRVGRGEEQSHRFLITDELAVAPKNSVRKSSRPPPTDFISPKKTSRCAVRANFSERNSTACPSLR